jgi:hypothetical protein
VDMQVDRAKIRRQMTAHSALQLRKSHLKMT